MPKEVIVIGGGIAGLTAASELRNCRVTLLEAKPRFGGRIDTVRLPGGLVELGAEFVHGQSKILLRAISAARLTTDDVSDDNKLFEDGRLEPVDIWDAFAELTHRIDTRSADQSFLSFLDQQSLDGRTSRMMLAFATGFNAAHAERLSAHSLRRAEYAAEQMEGDMQSRIDQGYSALVDFIAADARHEGAVLLNESCVRTIRWQQDRVEVETLRAGVTETFIGNAAIITLPLGVLKAHDVLFVPTLPSKEEAINGLEFGNVVKLTLVFKTHWWPDHDFGFIHSLDDEFPTWWSDPRGPILTAWAGGEKADALLDHSQEQLETLAIQALARIFATSEGKIRGQLISSHTHNWARDPQVRGAYSYIPVNGLFLPKQLGAPVDNTLFFAGEATVNDAQMGTVFGAMESGRRAAREVMGLAGFQS